MVSFTITRDYYELVLQARKQILFNYECQEIDCVLTRDKNPGQELAAISKPICYSKRIAKPQNKMKLRSFIMCIALFTFLSLQAENIITYTASSILPAQSYGNSYRGLKQDAFNVNILSHTFSDGVGTIIFDGDVTVIGEEAFYSCKTLTSIEIPASVTEIGKRAFNSCENLNSVNIPNSVTYIGQEAFSYCTNLNTLTIPNSVTYIGSLAFLYCPSLFSIILPSGITSIESSTFQQCSNLTSISIPTSVTKIGRAAFYACQNLNSIIIPNSVTDIEESAFSGCSRLTSITLSTSLTTLAKSVFSNCSNLTSITLPKNITSIGESAFSNCSVLRAIHCKNVIPPSLSYNSFYGVPTTAIVYPPCGGIENYGVTPIWQNFIYIQEESVLSYTVASNNDALGSVTELKKADCDHTLIVQAIPNTGCVFAGWNDGNKDNPRTMVVTDGMNLTAIFQKGYAITVSQDCNVITE